MKLFTNARLWPLVICMVVLVFGGAAYSQKLFLKNEIGAGQGSSKPATLTAEFKLKTGERLGVLSVTAKMKPDWYVYSVTQKPGGPLPSKITVAESKQYRVIGEFKANTKPHVEKSEYFDVPLEEHSGSVTWTAVVEISEGVQPKDLEIQGVYNGQVCKTGGACIPLSNVKLAAKFAGFDPSLSVETSQPTKVEIKAFENKGLHASLQGRIVRAAGTDKPIGPGDKVKFEVTATPTGEYHVYKYSTDAKSYSTTLVGFTEYNGWKINGPAVSAKAVYKKSLDVWYHHDPVTWTFDIQIPESAEKKSYPFTGVVGIQTCTDANCDEPLGVKFEAEIAVGTATIVPVKWSESNFGEAQKAIKAGGVATPLPGDASDKKTTSNDNASTKQSEQVSALPEPAKKKHKKVVITRDTPEQIAEMAKLYDPEEKISYLTFADMDDNPIGSGGTSSGNQTTFWAAMFGAFVGGMLLNLMPCVFPVLGLKVMGFVQQAGSDPAKIRMHGIVFSAGLVVSMWVLAGIILSLKLSSGQAINWGAQMGNPYFVSAIIVLLFLLGLNMAGVFEFGTSMTSVGGQLQQKKGYSSSFLSGVLTTLIATPCSGPFLGAAMSYTLAQPPLNAMFLFTVFALGISAPYLVLSFFPVLINRLPKPGQWMETFKVTMAFALFATVAFFMQAFGGQTGADGLAWLAMALVVIGLAAYFYGNWSESHIKPLKRVLCGFALPGLIAAAGFYMAYDAASLRAEGFATHNIGGLNWQAWNPGKVEHTLAKKKKIVWVDYTADW